MALTPPQALERQLGAAPMQPYVPGGRSPQRVLNAVSPALAASAVPAWPTRKKPNAMRSSLNVQAVVVHVGVAGRRRRRRSPHFDHVWRYLGRPKGVTGSKGITGTDTVTDLKGVTGMGCSVMTLAAALPDGAAEGILDTALGAAVEEVLWLRRLRRALAVAAPFVEPFHP
jgi:hypothetical protein